MAYPSKVLVPRPNSSRITKESWVAFWRTEAVSVHSTKKVPNKSWKFFRNKNLQFIIYNIRTLLSKYRFLTHYASRLQVAVSCTNGCIHLALFFFLFGILLDKTKQRIIQAYASHCIEVLQLKFLSFTCDYFKSFGSYALWWGVGL